MIKFARDLVTADLNKHGSFDNNGTNFTPLVARNVQARFSETENFRRGNFLSPTVNLYGSIQIMALF